MILALSDRPYHPLYYKKASLVWSKGPKGPWRIDTRINRSNIFFIRLYVSWSYCFLSNYSLSTYSTFTLRHFCPYFFQIHSRKLSHEVTHIDIMEMTKSFAWLFYSCVLSHFSSLWALEGGVVRVTSSSTWSLVVNIYLMGRHVSCMLDQSVTLIRSFSSPVWFSTFSSFIKTALLLLLLLLAWRFL